MINKIRATNIPIKFLKEMKNGEFEESSCLRCNNSNPLTQENSYIFDNDKMMYFFLRYYPLYNSIQFTKITITLN